MNVPTVEVLIIDGFHVPVIPFADLSGKACAVVFCQTEPIAANKGVTGLVMVMSIVSTIAHCPAAGVKV